MWGESVVNIFVLSRPLNSIGSEDTNWAYMSPRFLAE